MLPILNVAGPNIASMSFFIIVSEKTINLCTGASKWDNNGRLVRIVKDRTKSNKQDVQIPNKLSFAVQHMNEPISSQANISKIHSVSFS